MMMPILTLALKDLRLLFRDRLNFFFTFIFPVMFAVLFGLIFSGGGGGGEKGGVPLAVVNEDGGVASKEFIRDLGKDSALAVTEVPGRAEGEALVRKGAASACVVVPEGYSSSSLFAGKATKLEVLVDPARSAEAGLLQGKLMQVSMQGMGRMFTDRSRMLEGLSDSRKRVAESTGLSPAQRGAFESMFSAADALQQRLSEDDGVAVDGGADGGGEDGFSWSPVDITVKELAPKEVTGQPKSAFQISFAQGVVWGLVGCVAAFVSSLAAERQQGTLGRLLGSPLAPWQVLSGKALACFASCVMVQGILLGSVMLIARVIEHKVFVVADWPMLCVAVLVASAAFTGIMMAFASLTRTEASGAGLSRAVMLVLAMIGGGTVPLFMLPRWMQTVSGVSPFRWAVLALEGSVWRGMTVREMLLPLGVLAGLAVAGFVVGAVGVGRVRAA